VRYTENLFEKTPIGATSWIDPWSVDEPGEKGEMIETGHGRGRLAVDDDAIWVVNATSKTLTRIDRRTAVPDWRSDLDHRPAAIATGAESAAWVLAENGWLWRFYPDGSSEGIARTGRGARDLVCDAESVWVLQDDGDLVALDQSTGEVTVEAKIPRGARQILFADDHLIALAGGGGQVCRIERKGGKTESRGKLPADGTRAAVHDGALWVACQRRLSTRWGALVRVDLATMRPEAVHEIPGAPRAITAGAGHLWVACGRRGNKASSIVRVDPTSGEVTPWAETSFTVHDLAFADDEVLAATGLKVSIDVGGGGGGGG
jgi:outer membrane protein assembly factor BamB